MHHHRNKLKYVTSTANKINPKFSVLLEMEMLHIIMAKCLSSQSLLWNSQVKYL